MSHTLSVSDNLPPCTSVAYKKLGDQDVYFDIYAPKIGMSPNPSNIPAVVYFHGGGLTVGDRKAWFPHWLYKRTIGSGFAFLSIDYQLLPPGTGHDVVNDIKDFFSFICNAGNSFTAAIVGDEGTEAKYGIDLNAIAVAGSSAGGLCTYLAATVADPKPRAIISMYGMGGDFFIPYWLEPKDDVFVPGREILDPKDFKDFIYPFSLPVITGSEPRYHPADHPTPGLPANPRMYLARFFIQLGNYLDYYTGEYKLGLGEILRDKQRDVAASRTSDAVEPQPEEWAGPLIPQKHKVLFPQLNVTPTWPPAFLVHGTEDFLVPVHESQHLGKLLEGVGVPATLRTIDGKGHGFDYDAGAEDEFAWLYDEIGVFLREKLGAEATR